MEAEIRPSDSVLEESILTESSAYSFFQAVLLLERFFKEEARVGEKGPVEREKIRFRPDVSLSFAPADIVSITEEKRLNRDDPRLAVTISFMGLYGTQTPLPLFFTEQLLGEKEEAKPVREFLDLFHHRLISFFYRSWLKYRYHFQFRPGASDLFSERILALIGLGTPGLAEHIHLPSDRMLRYAGVFSLYPRSVSLLEGTLRDYLGVPVEIEQCTGSWMKINDGQRVRLGLENCRLSEDCAIGNEIYSRLGSFRIVIGPLRFDEFVKFLPGESNAVHLQELVQFYTGDRLDFELVLKIREDEISGARLMSAGPDAGHSRLGWTSWLCGRHKQMQNDTVVFGYAAV